MPSIDERIVSMTFENAKFAAGVAATMASLSKLTDALSRVGKTSGLGDIDREANKVTLDGPISALDRLKMRLSTVGESAGQGFGQIEQAANRVNMAGVTDAVDQSTSHFSVLQGAAAVALGNMAMMAVQSGASLVKSLSLDPVIAGFNNYETQINAVQTILANTGLTGKSGLDQVNKSLGELNDYANKTVYNFSEMAKNIGTFTAAGVDLKTATASIKGIANLAAMSGSSSQQASLAMYQLSQAIAAGKVNLQDWNSVVNAGMGGKVFQKALWDTAKAMGKITDSPVGQTFEQWQKAGNNFRQSLSAQQKAAQDNAAGIKKAEKDAADTIQSAEDQAASAVEAAQARVKDARKGVGDAAKATAAAVAAAQDRVASAEAHAADVAKTSARAIADAQTQVKDAHAGVSDAAKKSAADIAAAIKAQHEAVKQAAGDVKSALDEVTAARQRLNDALKPASTDELQAAQDKLATSQLDQADLAGAVTDAQREQTRATQDLAAAQTKLSELKKTGADAATIMAAQRAVEDASRRATDAADAQERALLAQRAAARGVTAAQQELTDVQNKGTAADANVKTAKDALTQALNKYRDAQVAARDIALAAEQKVADARKAGAQLQADAAKKLVDAETHLSDIRQQNARNELDAAKQLVAAQKEVTKAREDGAARQAQASANLIKAQQDEVKAEKDGQKQIVKAHEQAQAAIQAAKDKGKSGAGDQQMTWLTSDVLTNTLKQFTGDMSKAQLAAMGFNDAQIKAIQAQAKVAVDSATNIKTLTQMWQALKEEIATAWSNVFKTLFGDINGATKGFTSLHTTIQNALTGPINHLNDVLKEWSKLGGRQDFFDGLKAAVKALNSVLQPIKDAFHDLFPPKTAQDLANMSKNFKDFMEKLKLGPNTADNLRNTFDGFFAVLHTGWAIVKEIVRVFGDLLGASGKASGGVLEFTGKIGEFLREIDRALTKGGLLHDFFNGLESILKAPIAVLSALGHILAGLFAGGTAEAGKKFGDEMGKLGNILKPIKKIFEGIGDAFGRFMDLISGSGAKTDSVVTKIVDKFKNFGNTLGDAFKNMDFSKVMNALQTGLLGGIFVILKKEIAGKGGVGLQLVKSLGLGQLNDVLHALTGNLQALQRTVQATTLLVIAAAIGILALGVYTLSKIDSKALSKGLTAVAVGLAELIGAVILLGAASKGGFGVSMFAIASSLVVLGAAVTILAEAVTIFSKLSWEGIAKGLVGVAGSLFAVAAGMRAMPLNILVTAGALIPLAGAMVIMAGAVTLFGKLSWEELAKGLIGVAGALSGIGMSMQFFGPSTFLIGPGLIGVAIGMNMLAGAVALFGHMNLLKMGQGILGISGALLGIGLAIGKIPPTIGLQAAGLILLAAALMGISVAVGILGSMNLITLAKGLGAIAGMLMILSRGLMAMEATLPGAAALLLAATALLLLTPALAGLGHMDVLTIVKGLAAMAGVLLTLSLVGKLASTGLMALGVALIPLAAAMALVALGVYALAAALSLLSDKGVKGITVMVAAITAFTAALPNIVINFLKGFVAVLEGLAKIMPQIITAITQILDGIIQVVINEAPRLAVAMGALISAFLKVVVDNGPNIIAAGIKLIIDLLDGLIKAIPQVGPRVAKVIVEFLNQLASHAGEIIAAGVRVVVQFLAGLARGAGQLVGGAANLVIQIINGITKKLPDMIRAGANMLIAFIKGVGDNGPRVINEGVNTIGKFMTGMGKKIPELADRGFQMIIDFVNGIAKSIRTHARDLWNAGFNLIQSILYGLEKGIEMIADKIYHLLPGPLRDAIEVAKNILGIGSPSKVFMYFGKMINEGLYQGLVTSYDRPVSAATNMVKAVTDTVNNLPKDLGGSIDIQPTITPVLDLSQVQKDAGQLKDLTNVTPITAAASYDQAAAISAAKTAADAAAATEPTPTLNFEQNNYSPESLSDIEIYRQTKNQLSQVKSALGLT